MAEYRQNPNPPKAQQPKSYQEYLKDLDALLKRNTGKGLFVGEDVSSNVPMYLPGKVLDPSGIGAVASSVKEYGDGMTERTIDPKEQALGQVLGDQSQMTASDYLDQWTQDYQDMTPTIEGIGSSSDGGTISTDGNIYYSDGTMRSGDPNAYAIQSLPGGGIRYSDGSVREQAPYAVASMGTDQSGSPIVLYSDGSVRYGAGNTQTGDNGLSGLIYGIFGQERPITQEYGNINPIEPTPGNVNVGTDIRTRDLSNKSYKIPVDAKVVEVYMDDGTRFGTQSGHKGYGNSLLLQLPSGEYLRFSHMDRIANVKPGDTISAGQTFGTAGTTGNTYGEHLDLEYYTADGQVANPSEFKGFPKDPNVGKVVENYQRPQPTQTTNIPQTISNAATNIGNKVSSGIDLAKNDLAKSINSANPTGNFGLGITETLQNNPEAARVEQAQTIADIGTKLGAPELQTNELSNEQKTNPFRQLAGNLVDVASTPLKKMGLPDLGVSEAIAGGKTVNTDVNLAPQAGAFDAQGNQIASKAPTAKDYAGVLGQNIKDVGTTIKQSAENALSKAGEGVSNLASNAVSSLENVFRPKQDQTKRAVGDVKGTAEPTQSGQFSSVMDTASSMANLPKNDIRDPFFKMGGADMFKSFLAPGVDSKYSGALGLDTFTPDFYKDLGNISSVFGGSKDLSPAVQKYIEYEKQKYPMMSKISGGEGYDQGQVDEYNRQVDAYNNSLNQYFGSILGSVAVSPSIFTPRLAGSAKNAFASPSKANAPIPMVKPVAASFSAPQASASRPTASFSAPSVSRSVSSPSMSSAPSVSRPTPKQAPVVSNQGLKPITINKTPVNFDFTTYSSAPSAQRANTAAPTQSKPSNVFKQATTAVKNFVSNVFRKK